MYMNVFLVIGLMGFMRTGLRFAGSFDTALHEEGFSLCAGPKMNKHY